MSPGAQKEKKKGGGERNGQRLRDKKKNKDMSIVSAQNTEFGVFDV
jgi:hypothetical protein